MFNLLFKNLQSHIVGHRVFPRRQIHQLVINANGALLPLDIRSQQPSNKWGFRRGIASTTPFEPFPRMPQWRSTKLDDAAGDQNQKIPFFAGMQG